MELIDTNKKISCFITLILCFLFISNIAYSNSAEPPSLIIIVRNAPEDIVITNMETGKEGQQRKTAWETYYAFYNRDFEDKNEITLLVSGKGKSYVQKVGKEYLKGYNSIITLNYANETITTGKLLSRSVILVTLRVILTLIIEGFVFFIFRYGNKRSWLAFLIINLLTQGFLNIQLNGLSPYVSYRILNLIFLEFFVFVTEISGFVIFVREHSRLRAILYVLTANLVSLILGGWLITVMPV